MKLWWWSGRKIDILHFGNAIIEIKLGPYIQLSNLIGFESNSRCIIVHIIILIMYNSIMS